MSNDKDVSDRNVFAGVRDKLRSLHDKLRKLHERLRDLHDKLRSVESVVIKNASLLNESLRINTENLNMSKESLSISRERDFIFRYGIEGYKNKSARESGKELVKEFLQDKDISPKERIYEIIQKDKSLRFVHRKIMDFLLEQFDYKTGRFKEVHFSKIVKECRIGKNMAGKYFEFLIDKGFIKSRSDGYRKFYWVGGFDES